MLRREDWSYSINQNFQQVIHNCALDRSEHGTWITTEMQDAYCYLHELGFAHSVESWRDGELAGGIYGVRLGGVFFGESMYSGKTGGSKVALTALLSEFDSQELRVLDCQLPSPHLSSLGMQELSRPDFLDLLDSQISVAAPASGWQCEQTPAKGLTRLRNHGN